MAHRDCATLAALALAIVSGAHAAASPSHPVRAIHRRQAGKHLESFDGNQGQGAITAGVTMGMWQSARANRRDERAAVRKVAKRGRRPLTGVPK